MLTGRIAPLRGPETSAIAKTRRTGPVEIRRLGLEGDEQADRVHHGGPDMAIHHYVRDHREFWRTRNPTNHPLDPGTMGENIAASGLDETTACIGDRYRLGTALVEISQGRKPCWKPGHVLGDNSVAAEIVRTGRCGWYYRVLEPGFVAEGDLLQLIERPNTEWPVSLVFALIVGGKAKDEPRLLEALANVEALSAEWRSRAARMVAA